MSETAETIARKLTKPQRRWIKGARPSRFLSGTFVTYPPPNTHGVLVKLGVSEKCGDLTSLGLEVRKLLQEEHHVR